MNVLLLELWKIFFFFFWGGGGGGVWGVCMESFCLPRHWFPLCVYARQACRWRGGERQAGIIKWTFCMQCGQKTRKATTTKKLLHSCIVIFNESDPFSLPLDNHCMKILMNQFLTNQFPVHLDLTSCQLILLLLTVQTSATFPSE